MARYNKRLKYCEILPRNTVQYLLISIYFIIWNPCFSTPTKLHSCLHETPTQHTKLNKHASIHFTEFLRFSTRRSCGLKVLTNLSSSGNAVKMKLITVSLHGRRFCWKKKLSEMLIRYKIWVLVCSLFLP